MAFELEALVGHIYIVNRRQIQTTPPGMLVEVAPKQAVRGREADTVFTLVLPSGNIVPNTFYEQMALMATERYFASGGSVTAALKQMLTILNQNLFEHNQKNAKTYEANILCGVLKGNDLYLARVGAAISILRNNGATISLPENLLEDETLFRPPLGVQPIPEIQLAQYRIHDGTRLIFSSSSTAEISQQNIDNCLTRQDLEKVIDELKLLVNRQSQMMVVEFILSNDITALPVATGESSNKIQEEIAIARTEIKQQEPARQKREQQNKRLEKMVRGIIGGIALFFASILDFFHKLLTRIFGKSESDAARISRRSIAMMAFALPILIVVLVVIIWAGGIGTTDFEQCLAEANSAAEVARGFENREKATILAAWEGTLEITARCEEVRPGDPTINRIQVEAQNTTDRLNSINRRPTKPVAVFEDANITRLILQGVDLYALDSNLSLVYRIQLANSYRHDAIINMRQGAVLDGLQIGRIIDIAFNSQNNRIAALDEKGVLIQCRPELINECDAQQLLGAENWRNPQKITIWQDRIYLLDMGPDAGQLWRYEPTGSRYPSTPTEYFTGTIRPNLAGVVDFTISNTGNTNGTVYLLYQDGVLTTFFGGEPREFGFSAFPEGQSIQGSFVTGMNLNDTPIAPGFLFFSKEKQTIYETTLAGTYIDTYRTQSDNQLANVEDVAIDPSRGIIYIANGDTVYAFTKKDN
ncbi:hypothetical protein MASR2M15_09870 [Anaerolineales bacterium]